MPLISQGRVVEDPWIALDDDAEAVPQGAAVLVSLARWQRDRDTLLARNGPLGVRLGSDQPPALIADDISRLSLIALEFPKFTDGRPYSYARLLRGRHGFDGELRAVGNVLRDQFMFMDRCGIDSFAVGDERAVQGWIEAMQEISVWYQPSGDARVPAAELRRGRRDAAAE